MSNNGGPWGGGGNNGQRPPERPKRPDEMPDIDQLMNKGREQLRVLMGGGGRPPQPTGPAGMGGAFLFAALALIAAWIAASVYTVRADEQGVELFLGKHSRTVGSGLHFAPWPLVSVTTVPVTAERTIDIGTQRSGSDAGLMLTGDENVVDIDFQVVWNISDPAMYLFNLAEPKATIAAVAESAMREIIAQSELAPILNRDRRAIADRLQVLIQSTLDSYDSGVVIIRVNFDKADPPEPVIAAFRDVQDAEQERDKLRSDADAYANRVVAEARGEAALVLEQAEAYRAQVVNAAEGEASRFASVLAEYAKAPDVTRKRLYLETMEKVLGGLDLVIMDSEAGAVPYLPLTELKRGGSN